MPRVLGVIALASAVVCAAVTYVLKNRKVDEIPLQDRARSCGAV